MPKQNASILIALSISLAQITIVPMTNAQTPPPQSMYKMPPAALQAIVDAPRPPQLHLSPKRDMAALIQTPALPGISEVAQPDLKLAGQRINPRTYSASRFSYGSDLWLQDIATQKESRIIGLPSPLRLADTQWSPDQHYLAFTHVPRTAGGAELWIIDIAAKKAKRLSTQTLNTVFGRGFSWMPDSQSLLVRLKPARLGAVPIADGIPSGPNVQESQPGSGNKQLRTYPDLLKNPADAALFDHYTMVQLALLDIRGKAKMLGAPELFTAIGVAPNGKYLLTQSIDRPYSYSVPASSFPKRIEIRDMSGKVIHTLAKKPLEEGLPPGNDAVSTGPRQIGWRSDAAATVVWAEAQDGGDPKQAAEVRDIVFALAAPFSGPATQLAKLGSRYEGIQWGRGDLALLHEGWYKTRAQKLWRIAPDKPDRAPELLFSGSSEDRYNAIGMPVTRMDAAGFQRLVMLNDPSDPAHPGESLLLDGDGAAPEGARPFLDRFNLATKKKERLFHSAAPYYENVAAVLNDSGTLVLTRREAPSERPNYYVRDLSKSGDAQLTALTHFPHPLPHLKDIQK